MSSVMYDESGERDRDWVNVLFGTSFSCSTYSRVKQAKEKTNVCVGNIHRKELTPSSSTCLWDVAIMRPSEHSENRLIILSENVSSQLPISALSVLSGLDTSKIPPTQYSDTVTGQCWHCRKPVFSMYKAAYPSELIPVSNFVYWDEENSYRCSRAELSGSTWCS